MSKIKYKIISISLYVAAFIILLSCILLRINEHILITKAKLFLLIFVGLLIYISGYILTRKLDYSNKILKINLIAYFLIYNIIIFTLTLFDEVYGRNGFTFVKWNMSTLKLYMKYWFNIIPFDTIRLFINGYSNGLISFKSYFMNIFGNFCAFMPYAIFLPLMFKKMNKYKNFLITMILIVCIIEILQFLTMSGSCDIDDLILNVLGASLIYAIFKIKFVNKLIRKIFLQENV